MHVLFGGVFPVLSLGSGVCVRSLSNGHSWFGQYLVRIYFDRHCKSDLRTGCESMGPIFISMVKMPFKTITKKIKESLARRTLSEADTPELIGIERIDP